MNCQEVMEFMQRQLDGDLDAKEEDELHVHLMHCLDCAQMFERLQRLSDELTQLPKVIPPYSLVDAIMPQLSEIDSQAAASITDKSAAFSANATQTIHGQPPKLPWTRRFGSQFSWKFAGGVVAAGLILGFFAFNLKHPVLDQANSLLAPRAKSDQTSAGQMRSTNASDLNVGQQEEKKMASSPDAKQEALNPPTADSKVKEQMTDVPKAAGASGAAPQATTDAKLEKPQVIRPSETSNRSGTSLMAPSTSEPERMQDPAAFGTSGKKDPESPVQSPETGASDKLPVGTTVPTPTSAAKKETSDVAGGYRTFAAPIAANSLKSATGLYTAFIEDQHVVIRNSATKEMIFASKQVWQTADVITLVEWSKDDKLFYQVQSEGSLHSMLIDLILKTEEAK